MRAGNQRRFNEKNYEWVFDILYAFWSVQWNVCVYIEIMMENVQKTKWTKPERREG